jgi:hypothetical protein
VFCKKRENAPAQLSPEGRRRTEGRRRGKRRGKSEGRAGEVEKKDTKQKK